MNIGKAFLICAFGIRTVEPVVLRASSSRRHSFPSLSAVALERDRDYVNLEDAAKLKDILGAYWKNLAALEKDFEAPLSDRHWQINEAMSSGDRLWYVTGAEMARAINQTLDRDGLKNFIRGSPETFFEAYEEIKSGQP